MLDSDIRRCCICRSIQMSRILENVSAPKFETIAPLCHHGAVVEVMENSRCSNSKQCEISNHTSGHRFQNS